MNEKSLMLEFSVLEDQEKNIISAIFTAARNEQITLGRLDSILDMAKNAVHDLMCNTPVPTDEREEPTAKN